MSLKELYQTSPLGMVFGALLIMDLVQAALFSMLSCVCSFNEFFNFRNFNCNIFISNIWCNITMAYWKISDMFDRRLE